MHIIKGPRPRPLIRTFHDSRLRHNLQRRNENEERTPSHDYLRRRQCPVQWKIEIGRFENLRHHRSKLPSALRCSLNQYGDVQLMTRDLQVDDLIDFADSLPAKILLEIENFWSLGSLFEKHGYLHRRGYLLYGPQGSGKSSVVHQVVHRIIKAGHVAVFCEHPGFLTRAMEVFRKIEPDRPVICLFEDIDAIIEIHGDSELLQWLDGSHQIDKVINIATTNYPERLDRRIVSRPRLINHQVESPTASSARPISKRSCPIRERPTHELVTIAEGLSFKPCQTGDRVACYNNLKKGLICCILTINIRTAKRIRSPGMNRPARPSNRRCVTMTFRFEKMAWPVADLPCSQVRQVSDLPPRHRDLKNANRTDASGISNLSPSAIAAGDPC